jgi:hypothetical protein
VKFVEHHRVDPAQVRILDYAAIEDAFREESQAGILAADGLEADLVPNDAAELVVHLDGYATGGQAGGQAARLEDQHVSAEGE